MPREPRTWSILGEIKIPSQTHRLRARRMAKFLTVQVRKARPRESDFQLGHTGRKNAEFKPRSSDWITEPRGDAKPKGTCPGYATVSISLPHCPPESGCRGGGGGVGGVLG